jgi:hypothetical protein
MKIKTTVTFLLIAVVLSISTVAGARTVDPDIKVLQSYLYSSTYFVKQKEAAMKRLLDAKPQLANRRIRRGTVLSLALDHIGLAGSLGRRGRKLAELLVKKGANVNAKVANGDTLLLKYALFARVEAMAFLVKNGANVRATDSNQRTALHRVALLHEHNRKGRPKALVKKFLRAAKILIAAKCIVDAKDKWGRTPMALAAFLGNIQMTRLLIANKANVNIIDRRGFSVLGSVLGRQSGRWANAREKALLPAIIKLLRSRGAKDVHPIYRR